MVRFAGLLLDDVPLEPGQDGDPPAGAVLLVRAEPVQTGDASHGGEGSVGSESRGSFQSKSGKSQRVRRHRCPTATPTSTDRDDDHHGMELPSIHSLDDPLPPPPILSSGHLL